MSLPERSLAGAADARASGRDGAFAAALAVGLVLVYSASDVLPGKDAVPNVLLAAQIVDGGGFSFTPSDAPWLFDWEAQTPRGPQVLRVVDLDARLGDRSFRDLYRRGALTPVAPYYLRPSVRTDEVTGERRHVGLYGAGAALTAVPVLAVVRAAAGDLGPRPAALWYGAKLAASLCVAGAAAALYLLGRRWLAPWPAAVVALAYALGTPAWSMSSQSLWQHGPNELFLAVGGLLLARGRGDARDAGLAGVAFAAAAACRPTSALFAAAAAAWLLATDRRALAAFVAGALPLAALLAAYNWAYLGSPFRFGQGEAGEVALAKTGSAALWRADAGTALAGLFLSPSRGVLVFSPFLLFAAPGIAAVFRDRTYAPLRPLVLGGLLVLAVDVAWFDWWGGWSYGWRRLVDLAPVFAVLLVPAMPAIARSRWRRAAFAGLLGWAVLVQAAGAFAYDLKGWNARQAWQLAFPSGEEGVTLDGDAARAAVAQGARVVATHALDVDRPEHRGRLWSLEDNQIGHTLANLGDGRRARRALSEAWIASWRLPARGP